MMKIYCLAVVCGITLFFGSCQQIERKKLDPGDTLRPRHNFLAIKGIRYQEVKRRFSNGLSFSELGFQQEPNWIIQFVSNDTVLAYSPQKKRMQPFHLMFDHGDVYNFAAEWFRIKSISKDSIQMQRLQVNNKQIANDIRSDVRITYYSEEYISKVLKTTAAQLQRPTAADTAFIKKLTARAIRNPTNADSAFAGRIPVNLIPLSKSITVEKLSSVDVLAGRTKAYDYLFPEYKIIIYKAYQDFAYSFTAVVDQNGKIHLNTFRNDIPEYLEARKKVLQGIISVYLQNMLKIEPGSTFQMPHPSEITINVVGRLKAK
ncbi:hypothetical protein [Pedobacter duraquae]|uniref:Uncharacterized protein n=1 Tax=Pedobacter duraquae TaxID=425511 RepID=A0A4R6IBB1_9SPHI|nr:hypothetical protein [Pedobacter duraquae]TDO19222.1 hypothetical protein CLV32_4461 [Pedobacter duraquae]